MDRVPSQEYNIPSTDDRRDTLADKLSYSAFGTVSVDRITNGASGCHTEPGDAIFVGIFDQHDKRVGIRLP